MTDGVGEETLKAEKVEWVEDAFCGPTTTLAIEKRSWPLPGSSCRT